MVMSGGSGCVEVCVTLPPNVQSMTMQPMCVTPYLLHKC